MAEVNALVTLLREHEKDNDAELVLRGELTTLDLWNCPIGDSGAELVAAFLKDNNESLQKVYLTYCRIKLRGATAIAEALKQRKTAWTLNLSGNDFGDEGAEAFIEALNHNVCMTNLWVSGSVASLESEATIEYLTQRRNRVLIPEAVRRTSLCLIAFRRRVANAGDLALLPKEIVRMIAMKVWATRQDAKWIEAVSNAAYMAMQRKCIDEWIQGN